MIQWIALAMAADAECKASRARDLAENADRNAAGPSPMVIIRPVDLVTTKRPGATGFFSFLDLVEMISDHPWGTISIKRSDILNLSQYQDDLGKKYVFVRISEHAQVWRGDKHKIGLLVPGTIEEVTAILEGAK